MEGDQYPYSIKFSIGTIVLMLVFMLILFTNILRADIALGWILYGLFSFLFVFLITLLVMKRLIPALRGDIALEVDEEGISDYIRDVTIEWKDIEEINLVRGRSASSLTINLKWESDYGKQLSIPLRWVKGKDDEIYDTIMEYFENDKPIKNDD